MQDWKMTDKVAGVEYAGLENDRLENDGRSRRGGMTWYNKSKRRLCTAYDKVNAN